MRFARLAIAAAAACIIMPCAVLAAASTAPASTTDDRIAVSADGQSLTGTSGGGGASLTWLHNFSTDAILGVAAEHQVLGNAHWTFGSLNGAYTTGPDNQRYSMYGEAHEGAGDDGPNAFDYKIEAVGVIGTYFHRLSAQLEDRRIDVETSHGNLPKVGLSYLWNPHYMASVSYSHSVSGNLGTTLTAARLDHYGATVNLFAGAAYGPVAPAIILNFQSGLEIPGRQLHEGYVGASKPFPHQRGELSMVADYQDLSGTKHFTFTVSYIFHVGHAGTAP
jgi:hypothetical protein